MNEKLKGVWSKIKEWWGALSKAVKKLIIISVSVLAVAAIAVTVWLNVGKNGYIVLFPDMDSTEAAEVYKYLQSEGVPTQMNSDGEIMVPEDQWDTLVFELAEKGYPQSAPSYGTYFDNLSMTMTDSEKQQLIIKDLQDRLQVTLNRIDGVRGSVVTIQYPESSNYAWKENNEKASASVTLTLENSASFTKKNVQAVKNLVAYSAQQMSPEDVTVIDTSTGNELTGTEDGDDDYEINSRENYEKIIRERIEKNVEDLLSKPYGEGNVVAACTVSINYDKITEEMMDYLPEEDGEGIIDWEHIIYNNEDADSVAEGITGEEDNTDTPSYPNDTEDLLKNNPDYFEREITNSIGHVLTQTEKAQGVITDATIGITIKTDAPLSDAAKFDIIELVKNATAINDTAKITVYDWQASAASENQNGTQNGSEPSLKSYIGYAIAAIALLAALTIIIILIVTHRAKKKINAADEKNRKKVSQLEEKLEDTKRRSLMEQADESNKLQKETASEVKKFAQTNPELTAAIIRSMLKEDETTKKEDEEDDLI